MAPTNSQRSFVVSLPIPEGRRIPIGEARSLSANPGVSLLWRPDSNLFEHRQYAVVLREA